MKSASDAPKAHTPPGGYGDAMPAPVLEGCVEPLPDGAPDLRGTWRVVELEERGARPGDDHPLWKHIERIEQAGSRVIVVGGGVVHDMVVDGTYEHGVNDVMAADHVTPISVAATYEGGALVLRPKGMDGVEVRRSRDGEHLLWTYHTLFTARLARVSV